MARALTEEERFEIQRGLVALGHVNGDVDGILGSKTRAAIRALQKDKGLKVDGFPTPKILELLREGGRGAAKNLHYPPSPKSIQTKREGL